MFAYPASERFIPRGPDAAFSATSPPRADGLAKPPRRLPRAERDSPDDEHYDTNPRPPSWDGEAARRALRRIVARAYSAKWWGNKSGESRSLHSFMMPMAQIMRPVRKPKPEK